MIPAITHHNKIGWLYLKAFVLSLLASFLFAAQTDSSRQIEAAEIIRNLRTSFNRIEDYQVELEVSLDIPVLRMPRKKMTFYFKQPDRTKLEAVGFAMVPRRGLALSPDSLFEQLQDLSIVGDTVVSGRSCYILQGLEEGPANQVLLVKIAVDQELWLVRRITAYMGEYEALRMETEYVEVAPEIHLPQETHLSFQINERFVGGQSQNPQSNDPDIQGFTLNGLEEMTGEASIVFSNYRVNMGISDEFFSENGE